MEPAHIAHYLAPVKQIPPFPSAQLEAIARALAETTTGLTGTELGHVLAECQVPDVDPTNTKWKRLFNAFAEFQNNRRFGNHVVGFIHKAMNPARWVGRSAQFASIRESLNAALAFSGLTLGDDGHVRIIERATTLAEAEARANKLRKQLIERSVHADVLLFCQAELVQENYFHAVLEATKSVASKLRRLAGLQTDGAQLAQDAFSLGGSGPVLAINDLRSETERGEQRGFTNLLVGLFGTFRNPTAHAEKIYWPVTEQDALDILSLVSLVHRKLDAARRV